MVTLGEQFAVPGKKVSAAKGKQSEWHIGLSRWNVEYLVGLEAIGRLPVYPIPTSLCHVIYYHSDKRYSYLVGIGLRNKQHFCE